MRFVQEKVASRAELEYAGVARPTWMQTPTKGRSLTEKGYDASMKNQYFGDINDYHKYGLLRLLGGGGELATAVCWMLTPDDGRSDGGHTGYLHAPEK